MRKSNESGYQSFSYKTFSSSVVMAVEDTGYCFVSVEVGARGSSRDSTVFKIWTFGKLLESNKPNIPDPRVLPSDAERLSMSFVLVGDEAFAFFLLFLWGPSANASGSTSALWLIVLSPLWTFQPSSPVPR
jgi:hypothetical protein